MSAFAATMEDFEALLNESFELETPDEGSVVKGIVLAIEAGQAIIDIGYKMEGRVDLKEFAAPGKNPEIKVGDTVYPVMEVHSVVERFGADIVTTRNVLTNQHGEVVLESFTTMMGQQGDESTKIKFDRDSGQVVRVAD